MRLGNGDSDVDNVGASGIAANVDFNIGIVSTRDTDRDGKF